MVQMRAAYLLFAGHAYGHFPPTTHSEDKGLLAATVPWQCDVMFLFCHGHDGIVLYQNDQADHHVPRLARVTAT